MADVFAANADALVEALALEDGKLKPHSRFEADMVPHKLRVTCTQRIWPCHGSEAGSFLDGTAARGVWGIIVESDYLLSRRAQCGINSVVSGPFTRTRKTPSPLSSIKVAVKTQATSASTFQLPFTL